MKKINFKRTILFIALPLLLFSCQQDSEVKVKMEKVGSVYMVPAKVNGLPLKFIFDTGASEVSISMTEAVFMAKNGYLEEKDIKGTSFAQLADGSVMENTVIRLKTIEVGELTIHDVEASVAHNLDAPLLLGQSAIKKLGRIEFDGDNLYIHTRQRVKKNEIGKVDEKSQCLLDSLVRRAFEEYNEDDYMLAQKHIREARQLAINAYIDNRNWEIDYIDARTKNKLATNIGEAWKAPMPLLSSAFHANEDRTDGICVEYFVLLKVYALGLALHYSPEDGRYDSDMTFEDEFTDVVSILIEKDKYTAYRYSAIYYIENFNVAKGYCEKAIAIDSTKASAYETLGLVYIDVDSKKAIECYEKALTKSDADSAYLYRLLAWQYASWSPEQIKHLKKAAQLGDIVAQNMLKSWGIVW